MRRNGMIRRMAAGVLAALTAALTGCAGNSASQTAAAQTTAAQTAKAAEPVEIQVFIAASLNTVMTDLAEKYNAEHPDVKIVYNADSSGTLLTQIEEGYECDIFFSAAQKQMNKLEEDGLVVEGTRKNVVNNQVVVVTLKDSGTEVTGLSDIGKAESIALAGGSVPVGKYTRQALVNLGMLETVGYDLTGNVIYPIARVKNDEADDAQTAAAEEFLEFILSDEAKAVFESYYFDTNVE